ncbi:hypothetical protein [Furfurilactobacillus siliginis]|uniref:Uncharacterized protein n=1 Tax=Furfurilactobacillus siliginis TaxID=348151 RepID=A0A0R2L5L6_9LACO|nr:hypothetical protein [Furfurilactobacillus siliginis]KRN97064.1 hypothetical protein IV55_GL000942 [Furfurilactobacillus siliginis]GEK27825.1 hypothetical protein LSI01_01360 [Furfurilactobacillus siliginis]
MLARTKTFLKANQFHYEKTYIRPMMVPQHVYVLRFGKKKLNNRLIAKYSHSLLGRLKIDEFDLRLHGQHNPRVFQTENELLDYLASHVLTDEGRERYEHVRKSLQHEETHE